MTTGETDTRASRFAPGGTPEGHTAEAPAADEYGKKGTPAGELSPAVPHAADAEKLDSDAEEVGADHHAQQSLGPIDWRAWGAAALGMLICLGMAAAFALPTSTP